MDDRSFDHQTAKAWIDSVEKPGKSWRDDHVYSKLSALIRRESPKTILDVGCGQGICCERIELGNCEYTGVEPSPHLLGRAKELYSSKASAFLLGSAYDLPVPSQSYDTVFSVLVWHLLMDIERAADELSRVLVKNGRFVIITANPAAYSAWKAFYTDLKCTGKKLEGTMRLGEAKSHDVLFLHSFSELTESLQKVGLMIETTETFLPAKESPEMKLLISIQGTKKF